jgi:hypothetical protein
MKSIVSDSVERNETKRIVGPYNAIICGSKIDLDYLFRTLPRTTTATK